MGRDNGKGSVVVLKDDGNAGKKAEHAVLTPPSEPYLLKPKPPAPEPLKYWIPSVAKYIATIIIKFEMDYVRAAIELRPTFSPLQISELAQKLQESEVVQEAIQKDLSTRGLDDASRDRFVGRLWSWLETGSKDQALTAARILGRGFVGEKVLVDRPEKLPIENFDEGLKRMLGEDQEKKEENPDEGENEEDKMTEKDGE